ncbi:hypothetical protein F8M41_014535 [Gigaspora margarita]|uniref:Serine-threonine/tyrosine-protein kinase catalytic domain-containing protein n=1 Tax=Gigaspora margarita TaxID=4874 RepID=A0A8H4ARB0_GIGMA|nr:hypothetical protein F8M41_014535 [Gigaspora margarita]
MKKCWHQDPGSRPTADDLCETFKSWRDDEQIISNLDKFKPNIDSEYIKKLDTTPKCSIQFTSKPLNLETRSKPINQSTSDELREFLSKNAHIPSGLNHSIPHKTEALIIYENTLNSDQTENLVSCMQKNNKKIKIVHNDDEINVDNSGTINTDEINIDETLRKYRKSDKNNSSTNSTNEIDNVEVLGRYSKNDNIIELYNRFGSRNCDENIIENESIQIKDRLDKLKRKSKY